MNRLHREELEREAADIRERLRARAEELDRITAEPRKKSTAPLAAPDADRADRERLERRADQTRARLADRIEDLEKKARERIVPLVVVGGAIALFFTVGFVWMFYKTLKLSR